MLWQDTRPHLDQVGVLSQMNNTGNGGPLAYMGQVVASLLSSGEASCHSCPAAAQCPGGAILVPQPGWWHSAANSTQMHQCPYQAACGGQSGSAAAEWEYRIDSTGDTDNNSTATGLSMLKDSRSKALAHCQSAWYAVSQQAGASAGVAITASPGSPWNATLPATSTAPAAAGPNAGPDSQVQQCFLWHGDSHTSNLEPSSFIPVSYTQLQCAAGYTGNLCATCQSGYYASTGFQCSQCPSVAQTAGRGVLTFVGGTALVIVTTYANLWVDYAQEDQGQAAGAAEILKVGVQMSADVLPGIALALFASLGPPLHRCMHACIHVGNKQPCATIIHACLCKHNNQGTSMLPVLLTQKGLHISRYLPNAQYTTFPQQTLIVHIQHLVIVTRLSIQYPDSVLVCSAFLRAITAAGEWFGFSPSCLVPDQGSTSQAAARLMGSILIPMAVAATSLALWCAR